MALITDVKYEPKLKDYKDINPDSILNMVEDVRSKIAKLDPVFKDRTLQEVVEVIGLRSYEIDGEITTKVDLSKANGFVEAYITGSEGGCRSCQQNFRVTVNAQDVDSFWYCGVHEGSYEQARESSGYGIGSSKTIKKHYDSPCEKWEPRFSPPLDELLVD